MGTFVNRSFMSKVMHLWHSLNLNLIKLLATCIELCTLYVLGSCINSSIFLLKKVAVL
jgi:hypothetical protein